MNLSASLPALERILLTLWVGSLWVTGFMVAPVLFAVLEDRAMAGTLAGRMFSNTAWIGMVCGCVLLVLNGVQYRTLNWRGLLLAGMLLLIVAGQFVLTPMIAGLRDQGLVDTPRFGQLHGLAGVVYIVTSLCGLLLVAARPGKPSGQ
jgi:predicted MFS family arabinose efflux permease